MAYSTHPEDFFSTAPPERIIGAECEYDIQTDPEIKNSDFISPRALGKLGVKAVEAKSNSGPYYFLSNGGKIYQDVGEHIEYATPECLGPRQATAADMAGTMLVASMVETTDIPHRGLFRSASMYRRKSDETGNSAVDEATRGYHENYLIPRELTEVSQLEKIIPTYLASRIWAMGGMLRDEFSISQKAWGIGGSPFEHRRKRLTDHGQKPMCILPPDKSDGDVTRNPKWARLEVRFADPTQSPTARFLSFAATSLVLRMLEHDHIVRKDLDKLAIKNPTEASYLFASDLTLRQTVTMEDGRQMSALDIQEALTEIAHKVSKEVDLPNDEEEALDLWIDICDKLRATQPDQIDYNDTIFQIEFAARHYYLARKNGTQPLRYGEMSAYRNLEWDRVAPLGRGRKWWSRFPSPHIDLAQVDHLIAEPPLDTRARWRAEAISEDTHFEHISWTEVRREGVEAEKSEFRSNPYM